LSSLPPINPAQLTMFPTTVEEHAEPIETKKKFSGPKVCTVCCSVFKTLKENNFDTCKNCRYKEKTKSEKKAKKQKAEVKIPESEDSLIPVLLLGEPNLRNVSLTVTDVQDKEFIKSSKLLALALEQFRKQNGFGR
jgi:hypothetical protein